MKTIDVDLIYYHRKYRCNAFFVYISAERLSGSIPTGPVRSEIRHAKTKQWAKTQTFGPQDK